MSNVSEKEDPLVELVESGYYPEVLKIRDQVEEGYGLSFNKSTERLYLRKGSEAIIVPKGFEWFAINYYNLKTLTQKIQARVFISYPREDLWLAYKLHALMGKIGIPVYLAELEPEPGVTLWEKIKNMIELSDILLVIWTSSAAASPFVNQEIGFATALGKMILPVVEKGTDTRGILEGREYVELDRSNPTNAMASVCQGLSKFLSRKLEYIQAMEQQQQQAQSAMAGLGALLLLVLLLAALSSK